MVDPVKVISLGFLNVYQQTCDALNVLLNWYITRKCGGHASVREREIDWLLYLIAKLYYLF